MLYKLIVLTFLIIAFVIHHFEIKRSALGDGDKFLLARVNTMKGHHFICDRELFYLKDGESFYTKQSGQIISNVC